MIGMIALAAAVTAAPPHCSATAMYGGRLQPQEMALCYLSHLSLYPEQVRFRNVRLVGDRVCGEVNDATAGFRPFVFQDSDTWARGTRAGYAASFDDSTELFDARIARSAATAGQAERARKQAMEARARELLQSCD